MCKHAHVHVCHTGKEFPIHAHVHVCHTDKEFPIHVHTPVHTVQLTDSQGTFHSTTNTEAFLLQVIHAESTCRCIATHTHTHNATDTQPNTGKVHNTYTYTIDIRARNFPCTMQLTHG